MNIVDAIKSQLSDELLNRASSLAGESVAKTKAASSAAIPAILAGLSSAVSGGGADRVIEALKQTRASSPQGAGHEGAPGAVAEKGVDILNSVLGSSLFPAIVKAIGKFASLSPNLTKTVLGYLAPLVLSTIAKQFQGRALSAAGLSSFFSEQKSNIMGSMPAGLSLADIPGLSLSAKSPSSVVPAAASGLPGWLLPLLGVGLIGGLAWYFMAGPGAVQNEPAPEVPVAKAVTPPPRIEPQHVEKAVAAVDPAKLSTDLSTILGGLSTALAGIKDVPTAEAAVPQLNETNGKLDGLKALWDRLPEAGRAAVGKIASGQLVGLKDIVGKVLAINGVGDKLKPILDAILAKISSLAGAATT